MFFYTTDITEQKLREQLLHQVARLDYEMLTEIDMGRDVYAVLSFDGPGVNPFSAEGSFQEEARRIAENSMNEESRREYLSKLDYTYMKRRWHASRSIRLPWKHATGRARTASNASRSFMWKAFRPRMRRAQRRNGRRIKGTEAKGGAGRRPGGRGAGQRCEVGFSPG